MEREEEMRKEFYPKGGLDYESAECAGRSPLADNLKVDFDGGHRERGESWADIATSLRQDWSIR